MRQNKAAKQDPAQALLEKARREKQISEGEINAIFPDPTNPAAQAFYDQIEAMGIEISASDDAGDDEIGVEEIDLDLDLELEVELEPDFEPEDVELEDLEVELNTRPMGIAEPELANDPVRMYLKEIGQVQLLDSNQEIWLSAQMAASRLVDEAYIKFGAGGQTVSTAEVAL